MVVILLIDDICFKLRVFYFSSLAILTAWGAFLLEEIGFWFPQLKFITAFCCLVGMFSLVSTDFYFDCQSAITLTTYLDLFEARFIDFMKVCVDALGDTKLLGKAIELLRLLTSVNERDSSDCFDLETAKLFLCLLISTTQTLSLALFCSGLVLLTVSLCRTYCWDLRFSFYMPSCYS